MIRVLIFLVFLGLIAAGFAWLADQTGNFALVFNARRYEVSLPVGVAGLLVLSIVLGLVWRVLSLALRIPTLMALAAAARRHRKGMSALSRGMVAAGAGDVRQAQRSAQEAARHLGEQPLTLLLNAQAAQLSGDRPAAEATFARMAEQPETRVLGLRGLHAEARRRGDTEAAQKFAELAHAAAPLPWAGHAVMEHHSGREDWGRALATLEANVVQRLVDPPTATRQRAVLQTAIALGAADRDPNEALRLARAAVDAVPDLVPAAVLAANLLGRRGDIRRAAKLLETSWKKMPHPDLAEAYLALRPGDAATDRLARAQTLARLASEDPESRMCVARAAIDARDFKLARATTTQMLDDLGNERPTGRMCRLMAELEETENGTSGVVREWLSRASRAPRDKAWVADGVVSDTWAPVSPVNGKLDAFRWQTPVEKLTADWQPLPPAEPPVLAAPESPPANIDVLPPRAEEEDALAKLAAIRERSRQMPTTPDPVAITGAPDDPGPKRSPA